MAIANILSIAGSDPSGGAGIQADLKAISANGAYAMAALTALTAQNTRGVSAVHALPPDFVAAQIDAVFDDVAVDAVKIGMIATGPIARAVARSLEARIANGWGGAVVLDPVMIAKGGHPLLDEDAVGVVADRLMPLASVVTPNLPELAALTGEPPATTREAIEAQAARLLGLGTDAVFAKGGHLDAPESPDLLLSATGATWLEGARIDTGATHGTGCTLSSALAARLGAGMALDAAAAEAKAYVAGCIAAAHRLDVGSGHGPTHHFHALWRTA